ncbi:MAG: universal stress protein, partial [Flavobacteriales bacterium]
MDVMIVRSDLYNEENPPKDYTHILAATDLNSQAHTAAEKAAAIADAYKAKLTLFHVIEYFPVDRENEVITPENQDPMGYQINLKREVLNSIADAIGHPNANQEVITTNGSASMAVPDYAREHNADLMVIGSQVNYGVKVLLGATADGIVHRAKCDVLVVHPGEK